MNKAWYRSTLCLILATKTTCFQQWHFAGNPTSYLLTGNWRENCSCDSATRVYMLCEAWPTMRALKLVSVRFYLHLPLSCEGKVGQEKNVKTVLYFPLKMMKDWCLTIFRMFSTNISSHDAIMYVFSTYLVQILMTNLKMFEIRGSKTFLQVTMVGGNHARTWTRLERLC